MFSKDEAREPVEPASKKYKSRYYCTTNDLFITAVVDGDCKDAEELLQNGVSVNTIDDKGNNALILATTHNDHRMMKLLIKYKINVNYQNPRSQRTALHFAAEAGNSDVIKLLLDAGCDPTIKVLGMHTALDFLELKCSMYQAACDLLRGATKDAEVAPPNSKLTCTPEASTELVVDLDLYAKADGL